MKMNYKNMFTLIAVLAISENSFSQSNFSLFSLKNHVIQSQELSAVYLPEYKFSISTPLNVQLNINSDFSYKDIVVPIEGTNKTQVDLGSLWKKTNDKASLRINSNNTLFNFTWGRENGSLSLFSNIKNKGQLTLSNELLGVLVNGLGTGIHITQEVADLNSYGEIGVGITQLFNQNKWALGFRAKMFFELLITP